MNCNQPTPFIEYFKERDQITPKEVEIILEESSATTRRYLETLVDEGVIRSQESTNKLGHIRK